MTQPQISRLENGPRIKDLDKLILWAATLGIPEDLLWFRLPPTHGGEGRRATAALGGPVPEIEVLMPDAPASSLEAVTLAHAGIVIEAPPDGRLTSLWRATLDHYLDIDNLLGPGTVLPAVSQQAALISGLIGFMSGADRVALTEVAAHYAEFAGLALPRRRTSGSGDAVDRPSP